jgi:imidazolonepropionase-like amidohydrolase
MSNALLLTNLRLLDPDSGMLREGHSILVRGGRIAAVSARIEAEPGTPQRDLGGRVVMPGLIDCHVHVTSVMLKFANESARHFPASYISAVSSGKLERMLMRGFTTVRDAAGADRGHKMAVEEGLFTGPRLFVSGRSITQTGGHGDMRTRVDHPSPCGCTHFMGGPTGGVGRIADGIPDVRRAVRDEVRLGADQIKVMASGGVGSPADPIHFLQYSISELEAVVEEAEMAGTYVLAHAYTAKAIHRAVKAGIRSIEHGNFLDRETADLMAERGAYLVPTLVTYGASIRYGRELGYPEASIEKAKQVFEVGSRSLEVARAAGVPMAYGTDLMGEQDMLQGEEFLIRGETLPAIDVIRSATTVAAALLRREGELGVIAPGAVADLIVLDGNPLEDLSLLAGQGEAVPAVMKDGRFVKDRIATIVPA